MKTSTARPNAKETGTKSPIADAKVHQYNHQRIYVSTPPGGNALL